MSHRKTKSMRQKNVAQKNELNETKKCRTEKRTQCDKKCRTDKRTQCDKIYKNLFGKV